MRLRLVLQHQDKRQFEVVTHLRLCACALCPVRSCPLVSSVDSQLFPERWSEQRIV